MSEVKKDQEMLVLEQKGANAASQASALAVTTKEEYDVAGEMFVNVGKLEKAVKARKELVTKPLNEALKNYRAMFKPIENELAGATFALRTKMGLYLRSTEAAARAEEAKVQAKLNAGKILPTTAIRKMEAIDRVDNDSLGVGTTTVKVVMIDWEKFDATPYLAVQAVREAIEVAVRRDVLGNKAQGIEPRTVEGVNVTEQQEVTR